MGIQKIGMAVEVRLDDFKILVFRVSNPTIFALKYFTLRPLEPSN